MRCTLIALAALLAGCATTAQEIIDTGEKHTFQSPQPIDMAAGCIARNVENSSILWLASVRHGEVPTRREVLVRTSSTGLNTLGVFHIDQAGAGSAITFYKGGFWPLNERGPWEQRWVAGC